MIKSLTSLRFLFALFVFVSHTGRFLKHLPGGTEFYNAYFKEGYLGVSFFFILSGFVMSYSYKERIVNGFVSYKEFMIARFARIYPLHFLTLLLSLPVSLNFLLNAKLLTKTIVFFCHLFLIQAFFPQETFFLSFNGPSWSISTEMFFYVLFPIVFTLFRRGRKYFLFAALVVVSMIIYFIVHNNEKLVHSIFYINPTIRLLDFLLGIFLFELYSLIKKKQNLMKYLGNSWSEIFAVSFFVLIYLFHKDIPQVLRYAAYYWLPMILIILVFSLQGGFLSNALSKKAFVYLGEISFSFYLFHQLLFGYMENYIVNDSWLMKFPVVFIVGCFFMTILISMVSFNYFEKPVNKFIKRKFIHEQ